MHKHINFILLASLGLSACAGFDSIPESPEGVIQAANEGDADRIHLDLIESMIAQEQYFAALAHLEDLERRGALGPQGIYQKAEALRKMGRITEARSAYQELLATDLYGQGQHGLGLIAASVDPAAATVYLKQAVEARPTDPIYRNDLGYAYLLMGRMDLAHTEFTTAMQLAPGDKRSSNNLVLTLLIEGREREAAAVAARSGIEAEGWQQLREQASTLARSTTGEQAIFEPVSKEAQ